MPRLEAERSPGEDLQVGDVLTDFAIDDAWLVDPASGRSGPGALRVGPSLIQSFGRTRHQQGKNETDILLRIAGGRATVGNPRDICVADPCRCPLADRGSPGRTHGTVVANPRIRVC